MAKTSKLVGAIVILIGVATWLATGADEATALIPVAFGLPILVAGFVAEKERLRMHAMHVALLFALIGLLATAPMALGLTGGDASTAAVVESALTAVVLLVYLVFGIRSFVAARRAR